MSSLYAKYTEKSIPQHSLHDLYMITTHFVCTFTDNTYIYKEHFCNNIVNVPALPSPLPEVSCEYYERVHYGRVVCTYVVYQLTSHVLPRSRPVCWTVKASLLDGQGHDLTPTWRRSKETDFRRLMCVR